MGETARETGIVYAPGMHTGSRFRENTGKRREFGIGYVALSVGHWLKIAFGKRLARLEREGSLSGQVCFPELADLYS